MKTPRPPVGDTVANGKYRVVETLRNGVAQGLHLGVFDAAPQERVLVTTLLAAEKLSIERVRQSLVGEVPGRLSLETVSFFDIRGVDEDRNIYQKQNLALVERLPSGDWVGRLLGSPIGARAAISLGLSTGRLLAHAAEHGTLMAAVRPEYIWAERDQDGSFRTTGLSDRYESFLRFTGGACATPATLLRRTYLAPELHRMREASNQSLVFSLSVMIAEWTMGFYPFPDSYDYSIGTLLAGEHVPLEMTPALAHLLRLGMRPDPAERPSLAVFLAGLESSADDDPTA